MLVIYSLTRSYWSNTLWFYLKNIKLWLFSKLMFHRVRTDPGMQKCVQFIMHYKSSSKCEIWKVSVSLQWDRHQQTLFNLISVNNQNYNSIFNYIFNLCCLFLLESKLRGCLVAFLTILTISEQMRMNKHIMSNIDV